MNPSSAPWGGRFATRMDAAMTAYTESIAVDSRMVAEDIAGSEAHALMLRKVGLLTAEDLRIILTWLEKARADFVAGAFVMKPELEDVHMNVETYLINGAGPEFGGRLHTARSRNDQVNTDSRLYVREQLLAATAALCELAFAMLDLAEQHTTTVMPGYTHSQHAQPITFGYWASAHASAWVRDLRRLSNAFEVVNQCPLGACALAGTNLPIDRRLTAQLLGFDSVLEHALDATSSRDFLLETLAALTFSMNNLSRLAEELVYFSTFEYRIVELSDAYTSGSSIMPQKKNPDCAELTRAKAGRVTGDLMSLLTVTKSVAFGYSRDLQEDKPPVWDAFDQALGAYGTLKGAVSTLTVNVARCRQLVDGNFAVATQLANWLVAERNIPFRTAHGIVGRLVGSFTQAGRNFTDTKAVVAALAGEGVESDTATLGRVLSPISGVRRQNSLGGPAPEETRRLIAGTRRDVRRLAELCEQRRARLQSASEQLVAKVQEAIAGQE